MSIIKAGIKFAARTINDSVLKHDIKKAQAKAYAETGKRINHARNNNYHINAVKCFNNSRNNYIDNAKARHNNRDKFIADI
ncbi:MAG: hypothetical protein LUD27_01005 [Clostridia bacterium]|nr:hypothetical protein [Clostridia bacterium]